MITTRKAMTTIAATCAALCTLPTLAQDLTHKAPKQDRPIAIEQVTIHTVSNGVIENGHIIMQEGIITHVGEGPAPELNVERWATLQAPGKHIYPGLINAVSRVGLTEIGAVRASRDYNEVGSFAPEVRAAVAVNPDSTLIPVTRSNGILTIGVFPTGGRIPGRASVIRMDGWTWEDMAINDAAGLIVSWPNVRLGYDRWGTRSANREDNITEALTEIDEFFDTAESYFGAKDNPVDLRFEAMRPLYNAEAPTPLFINANDADQIASAVSWCNDRGLRCVIVGGDQADLVADLLVKHDVPVIINGIHRFPSRADLPHDHAFTLPARLEAAGVTWCVASADRDANQRNLPYGLATSVAYGLDPDAAIRGITLSAAEILGVANQIGSIETGKAATIIVTSGNPLDFTTQVEHAFIDGREIDLTNKQTRLRDKYRDKYRQLGIIHEH